MQHNMLIQIKRFTINLLLLVVLVAISDCLIGMVLRYAYFTQRYGAGYRTTYAIDSTLADVLIFGSSRANHHYVPECFEDLLNMTYYNTGRDGNFIFYQEAILDCILKRYTPKVVILDYAGGFDKASDAYDRLSSLLPYYKSHKELQKIIELKGPYEKIKLLSGIYPFNSQLLTIAAGNMNFNKEQKSDNKGYVPLYKEWQTEIDSVGDASVYEIDTNKINALRSFVKSAKLAGAKVFVIYSPVFQKFNRSQEIDICKDICNQEKVPFMDYSKDTFFVNNGRFFQDVGHLNNVGAKVFSDRLAKRIKQIIKL